MIHINTLSSKETAYKDNHYVRSCYLHFHFPPNYILHLPLSHSGYLTLNTQWPSNSSTIFP